MKTRFDLEEAINSMWSSASDLKTVVEMMYDSDFIYSQDRAWNVLNGLAEVMEAKIGKLEDTFCQVYQLNEYAPDDVKELRKELLKRCLSEGEIRQMWDDSYEGDSGG